MKCDVERAREMLGVPFLHLGRDRNGIDCVGLVAHAHDYDAALIPAYPRDPLNGQLELNLTKILGTPALIAPFDAAELQAGDVVAIAYKGPIRHVAIVGNHPTIAGVLSLIHTDSGVGQVVEHILDFKWIRRIKKVWR